MDTSLSNQPKLAVVVVSYHPDPDELATNVASYADVADWLLVWDNSEQPTDLTQLCNLFPEAVIMQEGKNRGLAYVYNQAMQLALREGCSHLMTMDQDSLFENCAGYWQRAKELTTDPKIGIFCPAVNHNVKKEGPLYNCTTQSGSIFSISMLQAIGGFREDLFIGMVDAEIGLKALQHGYLIYQLPVANIVHHIGSERSTRILGKSVSVSDYSPLRHYYDSRNRILLWYEFPGDYSLQGKLHHLTGRMKVIAKILASENNKWAKVRAIVSGTYYGLLNRAKPYKQISS